MKDLIDKHSKGKIEIKFLLVNPITSNRKRKILLTIGFVIFSLLTFYIIPKTMQNLNINTFIPYAIGFFLPLFLYDIITRIWLFRIKEIGMVKFLPESLQILTKNNMILETYSYSDIKKIRYKGNVPRTIITKSPDHKTFIVEFVFFDKPSIVFEIENKMYLTEEDENQFRTPDPGIEFVLDSINPKYGVEKVKKITAPKTNFPFTKKFTNIIV